MSGQFRPTNSSFLPFELKILTFFRVSLSHNNVYCCLICSKYFQGRGKGTHAYLHALDCKHYVYLNLHNAKFYCLPDNYEIIDPSLDDILYQLNPMFTQEDLKELHYYEEVTHHF